MLTPQMIDRLVQAFLDTLFMVGVSAGIAVLAGIPLAVFLVTSVLGLTGLWIAILADTGATVLVTLNALRLLRFNPEREA